MDLCYCELDRNASESGGESHSPLRNWTSLPVYKAYAPG